MYLLSIDDFILDDWEISPSLITDRSSHLNFGSDRRSGAYSSVFFGTISQPASWHVIIQCPDEETRDALTAVLAAPREEQVRLLAQRDDAGEDLVWIEASVASVREKGSADNVEVTFESNDSVWFGVDVETVSKTFTSPLDQVIHLPAPGNVPTQPTIRLTPTEQRTETTPAVGWQYRQRWMIANMGDEPLFRYPVLIPLGDTTGLTTTKALASGDDLRVWLHGLEQARTLVDWDTADTGVWVIVPALPAGEAITYEIVYGNPAANSAAEDGVVLAGSDLPAFDLAESSNYQHCYLTATDVINAGKGLWPLSSPLEGGSADFGVPGAWSPALTFENPNNSDSYVQPRAQRLEDSAGPWYQARLYAARWRGPAFEYFDAYAGSDPYDGVVLHNPFGIRAVLADEVQYRNVGFDKTVVATTVGNQTETSEVLAPRDTPYTRAVVIGRNSGGESWHVLREYVDSTYQVTPGETGSLLLYLPSSGVPAISPPYSAGWEHTDLAGRLRAVTTKSGTSLQTDGPIPAPSVTSGDDILYRQYIYPLPAGLVFSTSDTIKGQIRVSEAASGDDLRAQMTCRIVDAAGSLQALLQDFDTGSLSSEFAVFPTEQNRKFPRGGPLTLAGNHITVVGDYLVIELGFRAHATGTADGVMRLGDSGSTLLPENETATSDDLPWIEISFTYDDTVSEAIQTFDGVWTPPSPVKHFGVATWPQGVVTIPEDAESRVSVESSGDITVHVAAENLVITQIEPETDIYEVATELRLQGGGNAAGPYRTLLVGNARQGTGPGTPRVAIVLGEQGLEINTDLHTHTVWDTTFTTQQEAVSAHAVRALEGVLREIDATDIPALERIPLTVPNATFNSDLTGWEQHTTDGDWTYAATHDAAVGGAAAGSMKIAATVTDAATVLRRNTTYHAVQAGDGVEVTAWLRQLEAGSSAPRIGVAWYDAGPSLLATDLDGMSAALLNPNVDHTLVFAGMPPVGATQFRVVLGITATGDAPATKWFDDVEAAIVRPLRYDGATAKVTEEQRSARWLPVAPPRRSVPNGDFGSNLTGWALEDDGTGITYTASHDAATGGVANGSLSIDITANTGSDSVVYRTSGFYAVNGAERVEMSCWCMTDEADLHPRQAIYWYGDENDTALAVSLEPDWEPVAGEEYVRSFAAIVPPGMTRFRLAVVADVAVAEATGEVWFDDVKLNDADLFVAEVAMSELAVDVLMQPRWVP